MLLETAPAAFETVMPAEPIAWTSGPGTDAINCVALTNVVASGEPFHSTVAPVTKLAPLTVMENVAAPLVAMPGLRLVRMGTGGEIVNGCGSECPTPLESET